MGEQEFAGARADHTIQSPITTDIASENQDDATPRTRRIQHRSSLDGRSLPTTGTSYSYVQSENKTPHARGATLAAEMNEDQQVTGHLRAVQINRADIATGLTGGTSNPVLDAQSSDSGSRSTLGSHQSPLSPRSNLSSISRNSPVQVSQFQSRYNTTKAQRSRNRGFSLRRSLLARNMQGQSTSSGSVVELLPIGDHATPSRTSHAGIGESDSKKMDSVFSVLPASDDVDPTPSLRPPKEVYQDRSSLPHYEAWLKRKRAHGELISSVKALCLRVYKAILQIQDAPSSRDGRHISLCRNWKEPLIDERTGHNYVGNTIRSSRYTLWNFLPRQLFAQFSKLANFYFLCVAILQMIPGLSTTGTYTTIIPLCVFVCISMAKEGYDDLRRYRLDKAENSKTVCVLNAHGIPNTDRSNSVLSTTNKARAEQGIHTRWSNVRVGDIVKLNRDEAVPADIVLLHVNDFNGVAYVETMALDGETNLKGKRASQPISKAYQTLIGIARCDARFVVEDPNINLYNFEGKVTVAGQVLPLTNTEIIYRGSILRNTIEAVGMVVYTGEECKIRMNANKNPRIKAPSLQALVNKVVVILVLFVLALSIFNTVAYQVWSETTQEKAWYLTNAGVSFFPILTSFIIMFNTLIPLSLYVSLEIIKVFQMILMDDIEMYDEHSDTPMEARTSTINEELGQVR